MTNDACRGWLDLDEICHAGAEWHADNDANVTIKTGSRILTWLKTVLRNRK